MPLLKIFHLALEKEPLLGEKTFVCKYLHSRNILVKEVLCGMIAASMPSIMSHIEGLETFWSLGVLYLGDYVGMMHSRSDIQVFFDIFLCYLSPGPYTKKKEK